MCVFGFFFFFLGKIFARQCTSLFATSAAYLAYTDNKTFALLLSVSLVDIIPSQQTPETA